LSFKTWLLEAALAVLALYSFWRGFRAWRENRLLEDTAASRIRSAAQGYVELMGRGLTPKVEIKAPLTHMACTWWRYKIEERSSTGRSRGWTTIDRGTSESPFILDDGTGQCLIDPRGAEVFPSARSMWYGSTEWPEVHIPDGEGFLGKLADAMIPGGRYRYTEYRLQPHETLCALGAYRSLGRGGGESLDHAVAELLREWKQDQKSLLERFDSNHDGILGAEEWERARAAARQQVVEQMVAPSAPEISVLSKPADGRAFLLSASDGRSLARRLRRNAILGLAAGAASGGALIWIVSRV
jgi:E3 Ubiquitin ligase